MRPISPRRRLQAVSVCVSVFHKCHAAPPRDESLAMNSSAFSISTLGKSRDAIASRLALLLCAIFAFAFATAQSVANPPAATPVTEVAGHPAGAAAHAEEHHGLPSAAPTFGDRSKGAWVNSSMIVTWIVAGFVILFAQMATRRVRSACSSASSSRSLRPASSPARR